ncbi:imidazole glycerol phosphate synthase subunit HisH [Xenorhabdus bovienii]|uniref:imidazole glycerol phosphate synthase subunit HisH n=1 Tax=Xenorhabdus bovienii TaxID=40576 RepID=UPI001EDFF500|nr:imidazole glycerol phosphate synthase subunit HisH [Xenorhabdus bovienii]MCG3470209.1 imidazole glycerol phosphate synthase subunit HisH [Xenorhabdus bovienii]
MRKELKIAIIDYNMGNIKSIINAINYNGNNYKIIVTHDKDEILSSNCIILPGVGAFPDAIKKLKEKDLINTLHTAVIKNKKPTLGICLGMQLLFDSSEEITLTNGLGFIPGKVNYITPQKGLRVPHVGWNSLIIEKNNEIFNYLEEDKDFYFVHSLHVECDEKYILAKFDYGELMTAAVKKDNIIGMQFHPEKSQRIGLLAIKNFLEWSMVKTSEDNKC